ncbi:MAG: HAD-IA family hydrolase, partial [Pseudomonadota bacterium]
WPETSLELVDQFIGHGPRRLLLDVFREIGHPIDDASIDRAHQAYLNNYRAAPAARTRLFPNVREDLAELVAAGLDLGICTNKPHELTLQVLDILGLTPLFKAAVGADAVPASKPDPGHLLEVARRMDLDEQNWVYVGDTVVDQKTAERAGATFFAVPWGGGPALDLPASHRLRRLSDLLPTGKRQALI